MDFSNHPQRLRLDRCVAILLMVAALPSGPLQYLAGRLSPDFWFLLIGGFMASLFVPLGGVWFLLGAGAKQYRSGRAVEFLRRASWCGAAFALFYLPWFLNLEAAECIQRLKVTFHPN